MWCSAVTTVFWYSSPTTSRYRSNTLYGIAPTCKAEIDECYLSYGIAISSVDLPSTAKPGRGVGWCGGWAFFVLDEEEGEAMINGLRKELRIGKEDLFTQCNTQGAKKTCLALHTHPRPRLDPNAELSLCV